MQLIRWTRIAMGLLVLLGACEPIPVPQDGPCQGASERLGVLACIHHIPDRATWDTVAIHSPAVDQLKATKYLLPIEPVEGIEALFLNLHVVNLHYDLMTTGFPDVFPGLTRNEYIRWVTDGLNRTYLAGNLTEYIDGSSTFFGFTVWDDPSRDDATTTYEQVLMAYTELKDRVGLTPLVFIPHSKGQRDASQYWNAEFPIRGVNGNVSYEPYTIGTGYGTLRLFDMPEFQQATETAEFGFQDILVLSEAPFDVERVISGAVTGTRQGELSHLNVRSAARRTPNCFIANPLETLAEWEGQLVKLDCGATGWSIESTTPAEAEAWWTALRPEPVTLAAPDTTTLAFAELLSLDTDTPRARRDAANRYGSKGTHLATLYQRIPSAYQLQGFVVPFYWYQAFIENNVWPVDLGNGLEDHTFEDTLTYWLQESDFLTNALLRRQRLEALRNAMREAPIDPDLLERLGAQIMDTFGDETVMVRFRSSSNAEDALAFSGAGLYDSTSACLADELDADSEGPSHCDPEKSGERTLSRALGKTWASMWKMEAFEERAWYGIDHSQAVMGLLINTRSVNEHANIVAFTGSPTTQDDRILVNAQQGELDVVSSEPGVFPEKALLDMEETAVKEIIRVSRSSEQPDSWILSDLELTELGELFADIEQSFPRDAEPPEQHTRLLDTEWKVLSDGQLIIKQIRPFLRDDSP